MSLTLKIVWSSAAVVLVSIAIFLSTWGIPAPTNEIRKSIAVDHFLRNNKCASLSYKV